MAFTADAIIANIESRLGDRGSHVWNFYKMAYGAPWCAGEVSYTFNKTGNKAEWYGGKPVFYVPYAQEWMAKHWETVYDYRKGGDLSKVKKGDVIVFMWKRGSRDHIGFSRAAGTSANLYTIEGNTSGGKVAKRTRAKKYILAVYRPPYQSPATPDAKYSGKLPTLPKRGFFKVGDKGEQVKLLQKFLIWAGFSVGRSGADGDFGNATKSAVREFQSLYGLSVDGGWGKECQAQAKTMCR